MLPGLTPPQQALLDQWLPDAELVQDHSWDVADTVVLRVRAGATDAVLKVYGPTMAHFDRELMGHLNWVAPLRDRGLAPSLIAYDSGEQMLLTQYLPGELVQGSPAATDPETFRQAGALLALLHDQASESDADYLTAQRDKALNWLDWDHRIETGVVARLRTVLAQHPTGPIDVVPTHGDFTTRNWIIDQGTVAIIDFGRAGMRPAESDFARLTNREFRYDPAFEPAFLQGYGSDPRSSRTWTYQLLCEAVGAAVWSYAVAKNSENFEAEGHRGIARYLPLLEA